ncbi:MAG: sugar phosphate isomerase/epimerase family protein [Desulfosalsimonas sp.]
MAGIFDTDKSLILERVQVNIPFSWLMDEQAGWMEMFIENRLNPEIGLDSEALDKYTPAQFAAAANRFHGIKRCITVHGPFLDLSPGSPDKAVRAVTRQRLEQMIEAAEAFSPLTVVCHCGYDEARYGCIRDPWYEKAAEIWKHTARKLAEKNIQLMLENVYETDPDEIGRIFEITGEENIGCCLDVGHLSVFGRRPLKGWINRLSPYIGQIHLHDNRGQSDEHMGMGLGSIDFAPLFDWLRGLSKMPIITLEPHDRDALAASVSYLEKQGFFATA